MTRGRGLRFALGLALVAIVGIVGMLFAGGPWDALYFALAAAPIGLGLRGWWQARQGQGG